MAWSHRNQINAETICCIGAVFDFYAGTIKRAPKWMIEIGLEWFYRFNEGTTANVATLSFREFQVHYINH